MSDEIIRENSLFYSRYPHGAGSEQNRKLGSEIACVWKYYGLDKVETFVYKALLSFPKKPAQLTLLENSRVIKKIKITNEPVATSIKKIVDAVLSYYAFTLSANVTAEIAFCNFGSSGIII